MTEDVMATDTSVLDSWQRQVRERSTDVALRWHSQSWTCGELGASVEGFAYWLAEQGTHRGDIVANLLPRSPEAIIVQLGSLLAGATHLAIDPHGPTERIRTIVADAQPRVIVDETTWRMPDTGIGEFTPPHVDSTDAAYLVYTSGSSGIPKGVVVEHRSLVNLLAEHERALFPLAGAGPDRRLRVSHGITLSFDAAWDPLLWLVAGHELHLLDDDLRADAAQLDRAIAEYGFDVVEVTPGLAEQLVRRGLLTAPHAPSLLLTGGDVVGRGLWSELATAPRTVAVNLYGPSECTVFATWARIDRFADPVIGYPITGTSCRVIGADGAQVADGSVGELVVSGVPVARGYHRRPELTAERFGADDGPDGPVRWYRTGDLVRRRADGALEFLGRADDQVKIRGHRIEFGDVESVLLGHPSVHQAVVKLRDESGSADLVGYVVVGDHSPGPGELIAFIADRVPRVMVPATLLTLDELPLTPHGKVDRAALAVPPRGALTIFQEPQGELERKLAQEFCTVLQVPAVGRHDNFFELGGHSLLATVVVENLRHAGIICRLHTILENPSVSELARALVAAEDSGDQHNVFSPEEEAV